MRRVTPKTGYVVVLGTQGIARGLLFAALLSYWVLQAGLNPLQLVLLGTALEATLFCLQVPTGAFADAVGRRPATVIGYALLGAGLGGGGECAAPGAIALFAGGGRRRVRGRDGRDPFRGGEEWVAYWRC